MGSAIKQNLEYLKDREAEIRNDLGESLNIQTISGTVDCTACNYDNYYKASDNPNCVLCKGTGKITSYTDHTEQCLVRWITEAEMREYSVGDIEIGDVILTARYEALSTAESNMKDKVGIKVSSIHVVPYRIAVSALSTHIKIFCRRYKKTEDL